MMITFIDIETEVINNVITHYIIFMEFHYFKGPREPQAIPGENVCEIAINHNEAEVNYTLTGPESKSHHNNYMIKTSKQASK